MGYYLNCSEALDLYKAETNNPYFVDKTNLLSELIPLVSQTKQCICITRPRRFGKSVMAAMIGAFFSKNVDASKVFDKLTISHHPDYKKHINHHELIYIDFSKVRTKSNTFNAYLNKITQNLWNDLHKAFPEVTVMDDDYVSEFLRRINLQTGTKFIFVFDEWDYIFHKDYISDKDRREYLEFLADLTKDRAYVKLTYMTGILPIEKYSSGSSLNHFLEYTMATQSRYSEYFGFTDEEVDELYVRYLKNQPNPKFTREDLRYWYDGYRTINDVHMYNPRSVVRALTENQLSNYWSKSGPYSEVARYIVNDTMPELNKLVALMIAGEPVLAEINENVATAKEFTTADEVLSAMVVYGFLSHYVDEFGRSYVCIPNKELMDEFDRTVKSKKKMGYIYELAKKSSEMLEATLKGDTEKMAEILEYAHNTESAILRYNNEAELSSIVSLVYLAARDSYDIQKERQGGRGYLDFLFLPKKNKSADCIILELKVDDTPESALEQIKMNQYALACKNKLGEEQEYTGRILAYGISYNKKTGKHQCKLEILE